MDPLKVFNPDILEMIKTSSVPSSSQNCRITNNSVSQTLLQFESLHMNTASESNGQISESLLEQEVQDLDATLALESLNRSQSLLAPETQIRTMDTQYIVTSESQSVSQSILGPSTQVVTLSHTGTSGRPNFVLSNTIPQNLASQSLPSSKSQDLVVTSGSSSKDQSYLHNWNSQASTPALPTQPLPQYEVMGRAMNHPNALDHAKSSFKQVHFYFQLFYRSLISE